MTRSPLIVRAIRRLKAPPSRVFDALTRAEYLPHWFSPSDDITVHVIDLQLQVGGAFRLAYGLPSGENAVVTGVYQEIARPDRLVFTWTWEPPDPHAGIDTLVTVEIADIGNETEVRVTHEGFPTAETRDRHDDGWHGTLERLGRFLEPGSRETT